MKIFQFYQNFLTYVIVRDKSPNAFSAPRFKSGILGFVEENFVTLKNLFVYSILVFGALSLFVYLFKIAETFQEYSETAYAISTLICAATVIRIFEVKRREIFQLIDNIEYTIQTRLSNPRSKTIFEEANAFSEKWMTNIITAFVRVTLPATTIPYILFSYLLYFTTDLGKDSFLVPFEAWVPYEWRHPVIYLQIISGEMITSYFIILGCASCVCFPVEVCTFFGAFGKDVKQDLIDLNRDRQTDMSQSKIYAKICHVVEYHSIVKQLAPDFTDIFKYVYTIYFVWTAATVCDTLLLFQLEFSKATPNFSTLLKLSCLTFWSFVSICVYCDFGERLTDRFDEIDICFLCDWHLFPAKVQRVLPIIIINTQEAVVLQGFGNVPCTRETLKRVINGGMSYFIILREFV